jgi:hypothetical protein
VPSKPSRRTFRDRPIQKTRQRRCFARVEGNEGDITRPLNPDCRKRRQKSPGRNIRLRDRQGADRYAETADHGLQSDKETVENAPTLFWPMRQPRAFQPVGPIPRARLAAQEDVVHDITRVTKGPAFEQARTDDQRVGLR